MYQLQPVRTALTLLRWLDRAIPVEEVSWLTVHGGCGAETDGSQDARARLDRRFREREFQLGGPVSLPVFRQWLSRSGNLDDVRDFRRCVERLSASAGRQDLGKSRSFAEWREVVEEALSAAEWRLLNPTESADYQLLRRWNALLDELSSLNSVAGPVRFSTLIEKLEHLAAHMLFTLETRNAPVQILGISESAGIVFDAVWWLNAQASVWPPHGKAQPFLPWSLQREAHMPYADPAEDYTFALRTTKRVLNSGNNAVISFALQESDAASTGTHLPDREILLSPLVREALPNTPVIAVEEFLSELLQPGENRVASAASLEQPALEQIAEEPFVPFRATQVRGGVRFLELHAACPFRAFAELRLEARPLAEAESGLSPNAQGNIAHRALEKFWKEMKSQKELLGTTTEQHRQSLRQHIGNALARFFEHANEPWQQTLIGN